MVVGGVFLGGTRFCSGEMMRCETMRGDAIADELPPDVKETKTVGGEVGLYLFPFSIADAITVELEISLDDPGRW